MAKGRTQGVRLVKSRFVARNIAQREFRGTPGSVGLQAALQAPVEPQAPHNGVAGYTKHAELLTLRTQLSMGAESKVEKGKVVLGKRSLIFGSASSRSKPFRPQSKSDNKVLKQIQKSR